MPPWGLIRRDWASQRAVLLNVAAGALKGVSPPTAESKRGVFLKGVIPRLWSTPYAPSGSFAVF